MQRARAKVVEHLRAQALNPKHPKPQTLKIPQSTTKTLLEDTADTAEVRAHGLRVPAGSGSGAALLRGPMALSSE